MTAYLRIIQNVNPFTNILDTQMSFFEGNIADDKNNYPGSIVRYFELKEIL